MSDITFEDLKKLFKEAEELQKKDPIYKFMKESGFDPDKGDLLIIPEKYKQLFGLREHPLVRVSSYIPQPVLIKKQLGFNEMPKYEPEFHYSEVKNLYIGIEERLI